MDQFSDLQSNQIPPERYPHHGYKAQRSNGFMVLSLCFGIISITCCSIIFISMTACGLSILFASLSRGNDQKYNGICKAGITASIVGLLCSICITCFAFFMVLGNSEYRDELNQTCEQIYGISFDEMMKEAYPELPIDTPTN